MVSSPRLMEELVRRVNHVNTDYAKLITVPAFDSIINEATEIGIDNSLILYEVREDIALDLEPLVVRDKVLEARKLTSKVQVSLPEDHLKILRITAKAVSTKCNSTKEIIVRKIQHQKLSEALRSPFWKPSFEWEETLGIMNTNKNLDVYIDGFNIEEVYIDYIKKHPRIYTPSLADDGKYEDIDGNLIVQDAGLLLDSAHQMRKICDIAALIALRDLGNIEDFQTQLNKILFTQNHFIGGTSEPKQ